MYVMQSIQFGGLGADMGEAAGREDPEHTVCSKDRERRTTAITALDLFC